MIRLAEHCDVPAMVEFSWECYQAMDFDSFGYKMEPDAAFRNYHKGIDTPTTLIALSFTRGVLDGMMVCMVINRNQYFDNHLIAHEIVFHAATGLAPKKKFKILNDLVAFCEKALASIGVNSLYISTDHRFAGVQSLLEKRGHKPMGLQLYKDLKGV